MSAPAIHGTRRIRLLSLCLMATACQLITQVFVMPLSGSSGRLSTMPRSAMSMDQLEVGQKYEGTVEGVRPFGVFVDFGCESNGMVHISQLRDGFVDNIDDEVQLGQTVEVWVKGVSNGKIDLTMVESKVQGGGGSRPKADDLSVFEPLIGGEQITGTVKSVKPFGAFVEVEVDGEVASGLVHISRLGNGFVEDAYSVVSEGDEVQVTVWDVDMDGGKLGLSMRTEEEDEEEEEE
mmetsp:Transcript_43890/g.78868  ORF Transcript_43890/g.78868 Transcript_43890/m.78868 type:complete len:235 (+) Transcript_43890:78-782(+)